jgi:hypothetical protein
MSDFFSRILVRLDLYRILTEVMRKIFEGSMNISVISLFIHRLDTTLRFQSWPTMFTLVLKNFVTLFRTVITCKIVL